MPWLFSYSQWDGKQTPALDADDLLAEMADDVLADGDAWREGVGGLELRHLVAHCIEITTQNREQQSA